MANENDFIERGGRNFSFDIVPHLLLPTAYRLKRTCISPRQERCESRA